MVALFGHSDDDEISRIHDKSSELKHSCNVSENSDRYAFNWLLELRNYVNKRKLKEIVVIFSKLEKNRCLLLLFER